MKQFDTAIRPNSDAIFFFEMGSHALEASVNVREDANRHNYQTGYAGSTPGQSSTFDSLSSGKLTH